MNRFRGLALLCAFGVLAISGCDHLQRRMAGPPACPPRHGAPLFGCANAANLAAMVADPADLQRGRTLTPGSGARAARVIENYEAGNAEAGLTERPETDPRSETTR